jgi:hypothetical protein
MRAWAESRAGAGLLVWIQMLIVAAYAYALTAYAATDVEYFPEQAPPAWSWPAVIAVGVGFVPAVLCLMFAWPALRSSELRADRAPWRWLTVASAASAAMLLVMVSPLGWELFEWYVG